MNQIEGQGTTEIGGKTKTPKNRENSRHQHINMGERRL